MFFIWFFLYLQINLYSIIFKMQLLFFFSFTLSAMQTELHTKRVQLNKSNQFNNFYQFKLIHFNSLFLNSIFQKSLTDKCRSEQVGFICENRYEEKKIHNEMTCIFFLPGFVSPDSHHEPEVQHCLHAHVRPGV